MRRSTGTILGKMWNTLNQKNSFKFTSVFAGNLLAQLIQLFSFSQLIRISEVDVQSNFYFITSTSAFFIGFVGLKYDVAQIRPYKDKESSNLFVLATIVSLFFSSLISIYSFEIGLLVFSSFLFNNCILLTTRIRKFKYLILGKITQAITFLSLIYTVEKNFILLYIVSFLLGSLFILIFTKQKFKIKYQELYRTLKQYGDYPKLSVPSSIGINLYINCIGILIPLFLDNTTTSLFFQYDKFYVAPLLILGTSFSQVYRGESQHLINLGKSIKKLTISMLTILMLTSILYYILLTTGVLRLLYLKIFNIQIKDNPSILYALGLLTSFRLLGMSWMSLFYSKDMLKANLIISASFGFLALLSITIVVQYIGLLAGLYSLAIGTLIIYSIAFRLLKPFK